MDRILIVEDDKILADGIRMTLMQGSYEVDIADSLKEAREKLNDNQYQVIILDRNLPDGDGLEFCRRYREGCQTPVLFLTGRDREQDEIDGLVAGADDYITKPFRIGILRARVEALIRRNRTPSKYHFGNLVLDFEGRIYRKAGAELQLSRVEQELLYLLISHTGQTLTRDQLISRIWDCAESVDENTLSVTVGRLRRKLDVPYIQTVYGIGYRWMAK